MDTIIEVNNLTRTFKIAKHEGSFLQYLFSNKFDTIQAVNNISFDINAGSITSFLGPNGAGKSTAIKLLSGILAPSSGIISVMGRDPFVCRKRNAFEIGAVFGQRSQLWWDLPVQDTFNLIKKIYRISDKTYATNLAIIDHYLNINGYIKQPVRQLSLGQRMRTEVAVAILHNPKILFLDEPTIGLDIVAKHGIRNLILEINKLYNTTIILTTHDMRDIEEISDSIILIDKGRIVVDAPFDAFKKQYVKETIIKVRFDKPVFLAIDNIQSYTENNIEWTFLIQKSVMSTGYLIKKLSLAGSILDVSIKETPIEDIIHYIYTKGTESGNHM